MTRSRSVAIAAAATAIVALLPGAAGAQCAMCRRALLSPEGQQMIAAFRSGIAVLLAAPFATFFSVAYLAVRRQRRRQQTGHPPGPID